MFLLIYLLCYANALNDTLEAIIQGVNINQTLGDSKRIYFSNSTDCKKECSSSETFDCTAILWNNATGSCYTFDKVNITDGIFVDDSGYILFIRANESQKIPDVQTCKFEATESLINPALGNISYYESVSQEDCETLCSITQNCDNIISQYEEGTGSCHLYSGKPADLDDGGFILYTKTCRKSPKNCVYTKWVDWSTCSFNHTQTRTRTVLIQSDVGGVECADYELMEENSCNNETSSARSSRSTKNIESDCVYFTWSEWSTCDSQTCLMNRNRTSEKCENEMDQLPCGCEDFSVPLMSSTKELGCRVENFDVFSRPSSKGTKVLQNVTVSCSSACATETSFVCEAFSLPTDGNGPCILYGEIDQTVIQTAIKGRFLQDIFCTTKGQGADKVCGYSRNLTSVYPDFSDQSLFKNVTLNSTESCESYCLKNMEYTEFDSFLAHQNDGLKSNQCILYQYTNNTTTFTNGDLDLYTFSCSSIF